MLGASPSVVPELTLLIPLYRSAGCVEELITRLESLELPCDWELLLVDDGSPDDTVAVARRRLRTSPLRGLVIRHARNYGEHAAVLTGYRHSRGAWIVNLDDDLQNPPEEALRLWQMARHQDLDVVYGDYRQKQHASWRNLGSRFANRTANWLLDLPERFYLSSFRCVSGPMARQVAEYQGPYPYIDGLLSQYTQRIGSLVVRHDRRYEGLSNYNLRRLVRLWLTIFTSFSIMPLRLAFHRDSGGGSVAARPRGGRLAVDHLRHPSVRWSAVPADRCGWRISRPHLSHREPEAAVVCAKR